MLAANYLLPEATVQRFGAEGGIGSGQDEVRFHITYAYMTHT